MNIIRYKAKYAAAPASSVVNSPNSARYQSEADLLPDLEAKTLTVRLHHTAQWHMDVAMQKLCEELTATETVFPRSDLRMIFILGSSQNRRDQVV